MPKHAPAPVQLVLLLVLIGAAVFCFIKLSPASESSDENAYFFNDALWHPLNTVEGEKITSEWNTSRPEGRLPVVCSP